MGIVTPSYCLGLPLSVALPKCFGSLPHLRSSRASQDGLAAEMKSTASDRGIAPLPHRESYKLPLTELCTGDKSS
nr:MAG TPA: hypothetical protein [Caudoviricetes sp.]